VKLTKAEFDARMQPAKPGSPAAEWDARMAAAVPHGPDDPCTCPGCWACAGQVVGCTCDIDWDEMTELHRAGRPVV
jgi:hypothetical protein